MKLEKKRSGHREDILEWLEEWGTFHFKSSVGTTGLGSARRPGHGAEPPALHPAAPPAGSDALAKRGGDASGGTGPSSPESPR